MKQCMQIVISIKKQQATFEDHVKKMALECQIEGVMQFLSKTSLKVIACGTKEYIEQFIDTLHQKKVTDLFGDLIIEPIFTEKDFRGVFRIIQ